MGLSMNQMRAARNAWGKLITAPGCDDAPVVSVEIGDVAKPVTVILPYYENPKTLAARVQGFCNLPTTMREHLRLIIVDDCSPSAPAKDVLGKPIDNVAVFRIGVDVRWNWIAARNIGAHEAEDGSWLAMTDMDHSIPFTTMTALLYGLHDPETIYRFTRHDAYVAADSEIEPHKNSWFMTRTMFWDRVGGYNEAFSGLYGSDGEMRRRCSRTAPIAIMNRPLVRKEHDGDSSTTTYGRKEPQDRAIHQVAAEWHGPPKALSFPYERVL